MRGYLAAMMSYGSSSGRASRYEFWMFSLGYALVMLAALLIDNIVFSHSVANGVHPVAGVIQIAHIIPAIAVLVRRLHDLDRTGHWVWLLLTGVGAVVLTVFAILPGTPEANRFGPPLGTAPATAKPAPQASGRDFSDVTGELERLAALKRDGALSDAEYDTLKGRLLTGPSA